MRPPIAPPPIELPANTTLTYTVGTGTFIQDPVTHNQVEVQDDRTLLLSLRPSLRNERIREYPGSNSTDIYLEGRSHTPKTLPKEIIAEQWYPAFLDDPATGDRLTGRFYLLAAAQSRWAEVSNTLGSKIAGYFQITGGGE